MNKKMYREGSLVEKKWGMRVAIFPKVNSSAPSVTLNECPDTIEKPGKPLSSKNQAKLNLYQALSDIFDKSVSHDTNADDPDNCQGCKIGAAIDDWYYLGQLPVYSCSLT